MYLTNRSTVRVLNWRLELRVTADFIKKHAGLLIAGMLATAGIAIHQYLQNENIPLSILSSELTAGLPTLFILLAFSVISLTSSAILPTAILLNRSKKLSGICIMEDLHRHAREQNYSEATLYGWLIFYWCISQVFVALVITCLLYWDAFMAWAGFGGLSIITIILFFLLDILLMRLMLPTRWIDHLKAQVILLLACATIQVLIMLVLAAAIEIQGQQPSSLHMLLLILAGVMAVLSFFQIVAARFIWEASCKPRLLISTGAITGCIILAVCSIPLPNKLLVGYVLSGTASGGRNCVTLEWKQGATVPPELRVPNNPVRSIDLRIPLSTNDVWFARPRSDDSSDIFLISRADVAKVMTCHSRARR